MSSGARNPGGRNRGRLVLVPALAMVLAACSPGTQPSEPSGGTYTIAFPSTAMAVTTDTVQVFVFSVAKEQVATLCPDLVLKRSSNQDLPPPLIEGPEVSPCDLLAGRGSITIPYGTRAVLAIGRRGGADFLVGCAIQTVTENSLTVPIDLTLVSKNLSLPSAGGCARLADRCAGKC